MQLLKTCTAATALLVVLATISTSACSVKCDARNKTPVCGASGATRKTFANACLLEFAKCDDAALTLYASTSCEDAAAAAKPKNHVRTTILANIPPPDTCVDAFCSRELDWVCGSDGVSYENPCKFDNAKCHNKALKQVKDGKC